MKYIYMTEDNATHNDTMVLFKAGYTKHPQIRRGQLKQAARRVGVVESVNMTISAHIAIVPDDTAKIVEAYVLHRIGLMPSAVKVSREFFHISVGDREECYNSLDKWVEEALTAVARYS